LPSSPDRVRRPETTESLAVVGRGLPHDSASKHVAGTALYVDDLPEPAGTLHVGLGFAPVARGRLRALDLSAVIAAPGVVAVLTAADIPGINDVSPAAAGDDPVFAEDIAFHGQVVFAVLAETRDGARRAAKLAVLDTEAAEPILDVETALAADAVLMPDYAFLRGDVGPALAAAPVRLQGRLVMGGQEHFYLEGQVSLAIPGEDLDMTVHCSTQHPSEVQNAVAHVLGVPMHAVAVEVRRMGGGFGGKESQAAQWAAIAALGARVTGRPCKIRLDRDEDFVLTGKRHDFRVDYDVGTDGEGRIEALDLLLAARCGNSLDLSLGVVDRAMFHADNAYFLPAAAIRSKRLRTNTVSATAFRGFGAPQGMLAAEGVMDAVARRLGLDPLDVRKRNLYGPAPRDATPYGMAVEDGIVLDLMETLERAADYRARRETIARYNASGGVLRKGLALTPVKFGVSFTLTHLNQAGALVHVYADGSVHLNHGGTEMGQGLFVKVAQVVAEEFGIDLAHVKITATHTGKVPNTAPTAASSGSDLNGMAALAAAREIKARLAGVAAAAWGVPASEVVFRGNQVFAGNRAFSFAEVAKQAFLARVQLSAAGFYKTPEIHWDRAAAEGRPFFYFAYGAACSEVTIDTLTGEMRVDRVDILHDVGRSLNPAVDLGQIEGGFVQGMGWLTTEELVWDAAGRLRTHAPSTYKIPTAGDVPADFRVAFYESGGNRAETIYRSKAVGEPPVMLAISVFSAIGDAVASLAPGRVPPLRAPATPEAILDAVDAMRAA